MAMRWNKLLLTLAVSALAVSANAEGWNLIKGHSSAITEAREIVVKTPRQWQKLWKEHAANTQAPLPEVDFNKETVVAVFAGQRMSGGYEISTEVEKDKESNTVTVLYQVRKPASMGLTITMMTQPYIIIKLPKPSGSLLVMTKARAKLEKNAVRKAPGVQAAGKRLEGLSLAGSGLFD